MIDTGGDPDSCPEKLSVLVPVHAAPPRMPIFGAVDFSQAACLLGYRVTVCDARPVFATVAPFPYADEVVVAGSAAPSSCAVKVTGDEITTLDINPAEQDVGDAAAFLRTPPSPPGRNRRPDAAVGMASSSGAAWTGGHVHDCGCAVSTGSFRGCSLVRRVCLFVHRRMTTSATSACESRLGRFRSVPYSSPYRRGVEQLGSSLGS